MLPSMIGGISMTKTPPIWKRIEGFLDRIFKEVTVSLSTWLTAEEQIAIYTEFYDYCSKSSGEQVPFDEIIGGEIHKLLSTYLKKLGEWTYGEIGKQGSMEDIIKVYILYWKRYEEGGLIMERALNYLDRHWVVHSQWSHLNPPSDNSVGQSNTNIPLPIRGLLWREWRRGVLKEDLLSRLLAYVEGALSAERMAEMSIDPNSNIQAIMASFKNVSMIPAKSPLLELVKAGEIKQWCEESEASFFLKTIVPWYCEGLQVDCRQIIEQVGNRDCSYIIDRINFEVWQGEIARMRFYLGNDVYISPKYALRFEKTLKSVLKESLIMPIIPQISFFIKDAISQNDELSAQLKSLYSIISMRKSILLNVLVAFEEGFRERFKNKLPKPRNEQMILWINLLFALYCEARSLCESFFNNDGNVRDALNRAIRIFIVEDQRAICAGLADHMAKWVDHCFRDQITIDELRIDFFILLSSTVEDKKILQTALTTTLARRLIGRQAIACRDKECSFLSLLANHFGWGFVGGMNKMIADIEESDTLTRNFTSKEKRSKLAFDYSFQILNAGFWPQSLIRDDVQIMKSIRWDSHLKPLVELFDTFYKSRHSSRLLSWSPSLSSAEVSVTIASRTYSLIMNVPQFAIIKALEGGKRIGIEALAKHTGLSPAQIDYFMTVPISYDLVSFKDSYLSFNSRFTSPHSRINLTVQSVMTVATPSSSKTLEKAPSFNIVRELFSLQAAIVRHVKRSERSAKNDPSLLSLSANSEDVLKCVATLVEREIIYEDGDFLLYNPPSL